MLPTSFGCFHLCWKQNKDHDRFIAEMKREDPILKIRLERMELEKE